jgi:hypothetical protein
MLLVSLQPVSPKSFMSVRSLCLAASLAVLAAPVMLGASVAEAQGRPAARAPAELTVINARTATLTAFEIATTGDQPRLVGKLTKPLAPGKSVKLKLNKPTGCSFFVLARFDDETDNDSESTNLCGEKQIRLTD